MGKMCMLITFGTILAIWILLWIWQGLSYGWASLGCGPQKMKNHKFIEGQPSGCESLKIEGVCDHDDAHNMIGKDFSLVEASPGSSNKEYEVYSQDPSTGKQGSYGGQWKRYWG